VNLRIIFRVTFFALIFLFSTNARAIEIAPEITACITKNAPKSSTVERVRLTSESLLNDEDDVLSAKIYWKHNSEGNSNMLAIFDEPDDILGSRLLFLEKNAGNEIYLYMPALFKVRRITTERISSSMYGMDFSYEDLQWMYNMLSTAISEQLPDTEINGEPMYVFAVIPREEKKSRYEKIYSYFDKKSCVIRKVEFYVQGDKLRKVLLTDPDQIKMVDGILIPRKFLMRDIKKESETILNILSVSVDPPISEKLFDPAQLKEHRGIN
jgi:hypothetical protein